MWESGHRWPRIVAAFIGVLLGGISVQQAWAFHDGRVAECEGCHNTDRASKNPYNLKGSDPSSTCLRCHEATGQEYGVGTPGTLVAPGAPPKGLTPGGDFAWLKKEYPGEPGESHGHNIVAADFGYLPSSRDVTPGSTYPPQILHCTSCHDPHGQYRRNFDNTITTDGAPITASGSYADSPDPTPEASVGVYRLLGGVGYQPKFIEGSNAFKFDPPVAVSPTSYNRGEERRQTRVAYGSGMSEWCANCHTGMHNSKMSHPAGNSVKLGKEISGNYNSYSGSGGKGGSEGTAYLSLVPFEEGTSDYKTLKNHAHSDDDYLAGPGTDSNVSCLSCHRAHASGWAHAMRFPVNLTHMTVSAGGKKARYPDPSQEPEMAKGRKVEETRKAYFERSPEVFPSMQRTLCSKCHPKD